MAIANEEDPAGTIGAYLSPGETLVWSGEPPTGLRFAPNDAWNFLFGLVWLGISFLWLVEAATAGDPALLLFGVPFLAMGFFVTIGRFWLDARQRAKTRYGLTDWRIIIVSGLRSRSIKSLSLRTLSEVTLNEKADGSGVIVLGPTNWLQAWYAMSWPGIERTPALILNEKAREVYAMIRRAQIEELSIHHTSV